MPTYYSCCLDVEQQGTRIVSSYIRHVTGNPPMSITEKSLQTTIGDFVCQFAKLGITSMELKTERRYTGNLFVETWQNREWGTPGWLHTSRASLLWTYYIDADLLVGVSLPSLRQWLLSRPNSHIDSYRQVQIDKDQKNDTVGVLVPIEHLRTAKLQYWFEAKPKRTLEAANA